MRPLAQLPAEPVRKLDGVIFDLDDTILDHGALGEAAYRALFRLRESGLRLIACTGRPAGWGEVIQRQWPIDATVVENGAIALVWSTSGAPGPAEPALRPGAPSTTEPGAKVVTLDALDTGARRARRAELLALAEALVQRWPAASLADDNGARVTDVTLDIGEHRRVPPEQVQEMRAAAQREGVRTLQSSVHLHLTREVEDKATGVIQLLVRRFEQDPTGARARFAFIGDSANDGAAFAAFALTFGVANVRSHLGRISIPPAFVSASPMGHGFAEIAHRLVELRGR